MWHRPAQRDLRQNTLGEHRTCLLYKPCNSELRISCNHFVGTVSRAPPQQIFPLIKVSTLREAHSCDSPVSTKSVFTSLPRTVQFTHQGRIFALSSQLLGNTIDTLHIISQKRAGVSPLRGKSCTYRQYLSISNKIVFKKMLTASQREAERIRSSANNCQGLHGSFCKQSTQNTLQKRRQGAERGFLTGK